MYHTYLLHIFHNSSQSDEVKQVFEIRTGTEDREVIAKRRAFVHPLYVPPGTYYYDIAVIELGKLLCFLHKKAFFSSVITRQKYWYSLWKHFSERKVLYKYDQYGDSPTCLNGKFDISNKTATIQGFGITDTGESANGLLEATVITTTNENCTQWIKQNSKFFESANHALKYGKGYTFAELSDPISCGDYSNSDPTSCLKGIHNGILCSWGIENEDGNVSVSLPPH